MGDVINFPLPKDPRERGERLMHLARIEKNTTRKTELFNQATEAFNQCETNSSVGGQHDSDH